MTHEHLDSDQVAAYASGRLSRADRAVIESHLVECAACRHEVADIRPLLRSGLPRPLLIAAPLVAAAAAVLLIVFPGRSAHNPALGSPTLRPGSESEGMTTLRAWFPAASASVPQAGLRFVWGTDGADALYEITVTDSAGLPLWQTRTPDTTLAPPDSLRLVPGETFHWWVDVLLRDARMATTGVHEFTIIR